MPLYYVYQYENTQNLLGKLMTPSNYHKYFNLIFYVDYFPFTVVVYIHIILLCVLDGFGFNCLKIELVDFHFSVGLFP